jgi:hypothetical protein
LNLRLPKTNIPLIKANDDNDSTQVPDGTDIVIVTPGGDGWGDQTPTPDLPDNPQNRFYQRGKRPILPRKSFKPPLFRKR